MKKKIGLRMSMGMSHNLPSEELEEVEDEVEVEDREEVSTPPPTTHLPARSS